MQKFVTFKIWIFAVTRDCASKLHGYKLLFWLPKFEQINLWVRESVPNIVVSHGMTVEQFREKHPKLMNKRIEFVFDENSQIEVKAAEIEAVIHLSDGCVIILPKQLGIVSCKAAYAISAFASY